MSVFAALYIHYKLEAAFLLPNTNDLKSKFRCLQRCVYVIKLSEAQKKCKKLGLRGKKWKYIQKSACYLNCDKDWSCLTKPFNNTFCKCTQQKIAETNKSVAHPVRNIDHIL